MNDRFVLAYFACGQINATPADDSETIFTSNTLQNARSVLPKPLLNGDSPLAGPKAGGGVGGRRMRECKGECGRSLDETAFTTGTNWRWCKKCKSQKVLLRRYERSQEVIAAWKESDFEFFQDYLKWAAQRQRLLRVKVTPLPRWTTRIPRNPYARVQFEIKLFLVRVLLEFGDRYADEIAAYEAERKRQRLRAYREKDKAKQREKRRLNPEAVRTKERAKRARKPDLYRSYRSAAAARSRGTRARTVPLNLVWEQAGGLCGICGEACDPTWWEADHIVPISVGGEHSLANLVPAHPYCNRVKGAKLNDTIDVEWLRKTRPEWDATIGVRLREGRSAPCGTRQRYYKGCRCIECKAARAAYGRELRARGPHNPKPPKPTPENTPQEDKYLRLRGEGLVRAAAAREAGVTMGAALRLDGTNL